MSVVFDEVIADVSAPVRQTTEDTGSAEQSMQSQQVKRNVMKAIERRKYREQRLNAD